MSSPFKIFNASCSDSISSFLRATRSSYETPESTQDGLSLSKYARAASNSFCVPSKSFFFVVKACDSSCFFAVLCSISVDFWDLSTLESVMNSSYSFCAVASAAFSTHALVRRIKDLRLLHECGSLRSLRIKLLQDCERLGHCCLSFLTIGDGLGVFGLLLGS